MIQNNDRDIVKKFEDLERKVGREEIENVATIIGEGYPRIWRAQVEILEVLYFAVLEEQTFVVACGGVLALPTDSFSQYAQIKTNITEEHKIEYCKSVEQKLHEYVRLITRNKAANKSYEIPVFTTENALEIAQEAFEESFRKTRDSYFSKR